MGLTRAFPNYTVNHEKIAHLKRLRLRVLRRMHKLFLRNMIFTRGLHYEMSPRTQSLKYNLNQILLLAIFYLRNFFMITVTNLTLITVHE